MLKTNQLSLQFTDQVLFNDLNISLDSHFGKKVALVGRNGCGKSSFLKILNRELKPTSGSFSIAEENIGYLPQEIDLSSQGLVGEYLEKKLDESWMEYKIDTVLSQVGLQEEYMIKELKNLSGGEKVKVFLAGLLLDEPTILLLDEPTNNLDSAGVDWLTSFIQNFRGSAIVVSHDRYLINETVDYIWEIDSTTKGLNVYQGNYNAFLEERGRLLQKRAQEYNHEAREIAEIERWLRMYEFHPKYRFSSIVGSKKRRLSHLKREQQEKPEDNPTLKIGRLEGQKKRGRVLKVDIQSKNFDKKQILKNLEFVMHDKDRILIQGSNGSGKTTLLNIVSRDDRDFEGEVTLGENIQVGYLRQFSKLNKNKSILKVFEEETGIIEPLSRKILARYYFGIDRVMSGVSTLSYGQLKKLDLAIILAQKPGLLILDEPTNHLDIYTREELESFIIAAQVPMIVVSHDRYFVEKVRVEEVIDVS